MSSHKETWNETVANVQRVRGCTFEEAHRFCCASSLTRPLYQEYLNEAESQNRVRIANIESDAKAAKARIANAADSAAAIGAFDFIVSDAVATALGLRSGAPLSAVRAKLAGGTMLHPGMKTMWTQDAVRQIGAKLKLDYLGAFSKFLSIVPELYSTPSKLT